MRGRGESIRSYSVEPCEERGRLYVCMAVCGWKGRGYVWCRVAMQELGKELRFVFIVNLLSRHDKSSRPKRRPAGFSRVFFQLIMQKFCHSVSRTVKTP